MADYQSFSGHWVLKPADAARVRRALVQQAASDHQTVTTLASIALKSKVSDPWDATCEAARKLGRDVPDRLIGETASAIDRARARARNPTKLTKADLPPPKKSARTFGGEGFSISVDKTSVSVDGDYNNRSFTEFERDPLGGTLMGALGKVQWKPGYGGAMKVSSEYDTYDSGPQTHYPFGPAGDGVRFGEVHLANLGSGTVACMKQMPIAQRWCKRPAGHNGPCK